MGLKQKKRAIILFLLVVIGLIVIGIVIGVQKYFYELSLQFPDNNGENKSLCLITSDIVEKYTEDYRTIKRSVIARGLNTSGVVGIFEECDHDYIKTKIGLLSGVYVCNAYLGDGKDVKFTVDSKVYEGNFLIIVTDEDNKILYEIPIDQRYDITFQTESKKTYYLKFVGESAHIQVEVWRQKNE